MSNKDEIISGRDSYIEDLKKLFLKPELLIVQQVPSTEPKKENK